MSLTDNIYNTNMNTLGLGSVLGSVGGLFGGSSSAKKKKKSARTAKKYIKNAGNMLNQQYSLGEDNSDLLNDYQQYLADQYNDNKKYFYKKKEQDLMNGFINDATSKKQNQLQNSFDNLFSGYGVTNDYLDNAWNLTKDNDFNTNYINDYYNTALNQLDTAKARGLLNDFGYNKAMDVLNTRKSAGLSAVNGLTDNLLNSYRDELANLGAGIQSGIDNFTLGQRNKFTADTMNNAFNNLYNRQKDEFTNDLNNTVLGYTPFDVSDILAEARNAQGVYDTSAEPELLDSLQEQAANKNKKIGLGNQGIF